MISVKNLSKKFNSLNVLRDVSADFAVGSITAILGPNGSGKSTLMKCILGLVKPDRGEIRILGRSVENLVEYRRAIGYMPQIARYPENLTPSELMDLLADLRGHGETQAPRLIDLFNLKDELQKPFRVLSGGTKQKVSAVLALMFSAELLLVDEPTAGLDPIMSQRFKSLIREEARSGKTILLTSHVMSEVEALADQLVLLIEGRVVFDGSVAEFISTNGSGGLENAIAHRLSQSTMNTFEAETARDDREIKK